MDKNSTKESQFTSQQLLGYQEKSTTSTSVKVYLKFLIAAFLSFALQEQQEENPEIFSMQTESTVERYFVCALRSRSKDTPLINKLAASRAHDFQDERFVPLA